MSESAVRPFNITNRTVAGIAIPMTLGYLTTPLLGLVDTAVVGQLDDPALIGGLAVGAILIDLLFGTFNFLRASTTGLAAQSFGAGDRPEAQAVLIRALMIAVVMGGIIALASPLLLQLGLWFMAPTAGVAAATSTYFVVRLLSAPASLGNYVILGWVVGQDRSGLGLALQILLNGTNIIMSVTLGLWMGWGLFGVAVGTVIGEVLAFFVGSVICWRMSDRRFRPSWTQVREMHAIKRLMNLNGDIMLRSFILIFAFVFFTKQGTAFGEVTLAANAILMHFFLIGGYFLDGLATAAEQLTGRSVGAKYRAGFLRGLKLTTIWNLTLASCLSMIFLLLGTHLIDLLTVNEAVRAEARIYMLWAVMTPMAGVIAFQMDGIFIGATWSRDMSMMMIVSLIVYLAVWWLTKDSMQNHGLWLALTAFLLCRGVTLSAMVPMRLRQTFPAGLANPKA